MRRRYYLAEYPALRARLETEEHRTAAEAVGWGIELRTGICSHCGKRTDLTYLGICPPAFKALAGGQAVHHV